MEEILSYLGWQGTAVLPEPVPFIREGRLASAFRVFPIICGEGSLQ